MPSDLDQIFKAYDIRGTYPDQLNEDLARRIGNAFARFVEHSPIVVARDMRVSSDPLSEAFIDGVTMTGAEVISIGLSSTDMAYFAAGHFDAPAAMFTASHNPAKYNGIKCVAPERHRLAKRPALKRSRLWLLKECWFVEKKRAEYSTKNY